MIEAVPQPWPYRSVYDNLPPYFSEPAPAKHWDVRHLADQVARVRHLAAAAPPRSSRELSVPYGGRAPALSAVFFRLVPLRRAPLAAALAPWWVGEARSGVVRVRGRLELGPPEGDAHVGWTMEGRVKLNPLHWVPVVVELWPLYQDFTRVTMTPRVPVFASKHYFRRGHAVLDCLWAELAEVSAHADMST
jgi:hypothetical protein